MDNYIILGGGASGVFCAINLAKKFGGDKVTVLEGSDRILKKVALTGNGQCNISNVNMDSTHFFGDKKFVQDCLDIYSVDDTRSTLESMGIATTISKNGRVYPRSFQASSVVDMMRFECNRLGIKIMLNNKVQSIKKQNGVFHISTNERVYKCGKLIYAMGGVAYPKLLTSQENVKHILSLGHTFNKSIPALVQLKGENSSLQMLKGIKFDVKMSIKINNKVVASNRGEIHFADGALSGVCTFVLSPYATTAIAENKPVQASIDFFPDEENGELLEYFFDRADKLSHLTLENFFTSLLHNQIGRAIIKESGLNINTPISKLTDDNFITLMKVAKNYIVNLTGSYGFNFAQVSLGGVPTAEIDNSMQSRKVSNLYFIGEAVDVTGECGGYNLQWAFTSAMLVER